jgi:hypothetical protein
MIMCIIFEIKVKRLQLIQPEYLSVLCIHPLFISSQKETEIKIWLCNEIVYQSKCKNKIIWPKNITVLFLYPLYHWCCILLLVRDGLLLNAKWAIVLLYHDENQCVLLYHDENQCVLLCHDENQLFCYVTTRTNCSAVSWPEPITFRRDDDGDDDVRFVLDEHG